MSRRSIVRLGTLIAAFAVALPLAVEAEPRAVVELFTSQGCSSCPEADRLLAELSKDPKVVALTLPINYWDYLGWKDTLADMRNTSRQKAYSRIRGDRAVYTPQLVVNGVAHAPGNDRTAVEQAVQQSRDQTDVLSLPIKLSIDKGLVTVEAPAAPTDTNTAEVWLCPLTRTVKVSIGRGENSGKTVTYTNVVRNWVKLGSWVGAESRWRVPIKELGATDADALAVLVQSGTPEQPGPMVGAALAAIH